MLAFALYDFRRLIQAWLAASCILIMFCISANFFGLVFYSEQRLADFRMCTNAAACRKLIEKIAGDEYTLVSAALTLVYGSIGMLVRRIERRLFLFCLLSCYFKAFFTSRLPHFVHQFYVVCNCSLVALFYLQLLPNTTAWSLLGGIVVWGEGCKQRARREERNCICNAAAFEDIFAVLTPLGPLRRVTSKAQDYSADVLRFLMFSTGQDTEEDEQTVAASGAKSDDRRRSLSRSDDDDDDDEKSADDKSVCHRRRRSLTPPPLPSKSAAHSTWSLATDATVAAAAAATAIAAAKPIARAPKTAHDALNDCKQTIFCV